MLLIVGRHWFCITIDIICILYIALVCDTFFVHFLLLLAPVYSNLAIAGQVGMLPDKAAAVTESESSNNLRAFVG